MMRALGASGTSEGLLEDARQAARAAADSAGITIRLLHQVEEFSEVVALFERIWASDLARGPVNTETLRAISTAGSWSVRAWGSLPHPHSRHCTAISRASTLECVAAACHGTPAAPGAGRTPGR
ncbi:hypothetical protein [Arthrobacter sp. CJ23]|uniref:hypothetical protein n=1 Tax=Arthrobacter sp. CJ23 TaxID=2972479 RepID=UPI00215D2682|nr:hypothetical protein [Arthrobacter sp. CJ23]UVJ37789.1 hypothetical protein NVV90_10875 [Arthrobacter sp. CJ23]